MGRRTVDAALVEGIGQDSNIPFTFSASGRLSENQPTRRRATLVHFVL